MRIRKLIFILLVVITLFTISNYQNNKDYNFSHLSSETNVGEEFEILGSVEAYSYSLKYRVIDENSVKLIKFTPSNSGSTLEKVLNLNTTVNYDEKEYYVSEIGESAFEGAKIEYLNLPKQLKVIGVKAFKNSSLKSLNIVDSVERIENEAFYDSGLLYVNCGVNIKVIGAKAFYNTPLVYFNFNGNCPSVGVDVFAGEKTSSLQIYYRSQEDSNWSIDYVALDIATGQWLSTTEGVENYILVNETSSVFLNYTSADAIYAYDRQGIRYKLNVTQLGDSYKYEAYVNGEVLDEGTSVIVIPEKVMYGANEYDVTKIENVTGNFTTVSIANNITSLDDNAFDNCDNLASVFWNNVNDVSISSGAFSDCASLEKIVIKEQINKELLLINSNLIYNSFTLKDGYDNQGILYTIKDNYAIVGSDLSDDDERSNTSNYKGSSSVSHEEGYAIIPDYVMVDGEYYPVKGFGRYAFYNNNNLIKIKFNSFIGNDSNEENYLGVWDCTFRNTFMLQEIIIDSRNTNYGVDTKGNYSILYGLSNGKFSEVIKATANVTEYDSTLEINELASVIWPYAFNGCTKLTSVNLENIVEVGMFAFENTSLATIDLNNPTINLDFNKNMHIGDYAFANCILLETINVGSRTTLGDAVFRNCYSIKEFVVDAYNEKYAVDSTSGILYEKQDDYVIIMQAPAAKELDNKKIEINSIADKVVKYIDEYAFAYSKYEEVIISDNVYVIGKAAFENCVKLKTIKIGKNVSYIGLARNKNEEADTILDNVIGEISSQTRSYQVYEQEVFGNCYVLNGVEVDKNNLYYTSDTNGVLYNKDKTILLLYAPGISRVSFTLPNSIVKIALEAFENNTHIKRLTLPQSLEEIGAKAFNACVYLETIYFRSVEAPVIHDQVFNSTGANAKDGLVVYCVPEPLSWIGDKEYMWNSYNVCKYEAIQEIPNQSLEGDDIYIIYVQDTDGNAIEGVEAIVNSNGAQRSNISNELGQICFRMPLEECLYENNSVELTLTDLYSRYYNYYSSRFELDLNTLVSYVTLVYETDVIGISCDGEDITNEEYILNTASTLSNGQYEDVVLKINTINDTAMEEIELGIYKRVNDGEVLISKYLFSGDSGYDVIIEQDSQETIISYKTFVFTINPTSLYKDGVKNADDIFVRYIIKDENGEEIITESEINIWIFEYQYSADIFCAGSDGLKLDLSEVFPVGHGLAEKFANFTLDAKIGIELFDIYYIKDRIIVTINIDEEAFRDNGYLDKQGFQFFKIVKLLNNVRKLGIKNFPNIIKNFGQKPTDSFIRFDYYGALEILVNRDVQTLEVANSLVGLEINWAFEYGATFNFVVPIRVDIYLNIHGAAVSTHTGVISETTGIFGDDKVEITLEGLIGLRGGVGCKIVSVGMYGEVGLNFLLSYDGGEITLDKITALGEVGVYLNINLIFYRKLIKEPIISVSKVLLDRTNDNKYLVVSEDGESAEVSSYEDIVRYAYRRAARSSNEFTAWEDDKAYNEYDGLNPEIVVSGSGTYAFYIDNVLNYDNLTSNDTTTYDNYNYMKLVYSKLEDNNQWSKPTIIFDNYQNDVYFEVDKYNDKLIITLINLDRQLNQNDTEYDNLLNIEIIEFDGNNASNVISVTPKVYNGTKNYVSHISTTIYDNNLYMSWIENSDDNTKALGFEENVLNESIHNTLYVNKYSLENYELIKSSNTKVEGVVAEFSYISLDSQLGIIIINDDDNYLGTVEDKKLLGYRIDNESISYLGEYATKAAYSGINYDELAKTTLLVDGELVELKADLTYTSYGVSGLDNTYKILYNDDKSIYGIAIVQSDDTLENDDVYFIMYDSTSNSFGKPVNITNLENGNRVTSYDVYWTNDALYLYSISAYEEEVIRYNKNCQMVSVEEDLQLNLVEFDAESFELGKEFDVTVEVTNNSLTSVNALDLIIKADENEIISLELNDVYILSGDTQTLSINSLVINELNESYTVVLESNLEEENLENNTKLVSFASPDLEVNAKYVVLGDEEYIYVRVNNIGSYPVNNFTISVFNEGLSEVMPASEDACLYSLSYDKILDVNSNKDFTIEINDYYFVNQVVTVLVSSTQEEILTSNNKISVGIQENSSYANGNFHNINYYIDGVFYTSQEYEFGQTINALEISNKEGYTFSGWVGIVDTMPNNEVNVFGYYVANTYNISYVVDGSEYRSVEYTYGQNIYYIDNPILEGHTFSGWNCEYETMPASDIEITGTFQVNKHTINYYVDNVLVHSETLDYNDVIDLFTYEVLPGYDFTGWDCQHLRMPDSDLNVYGSTIAKTYLLEYYVDGEYYSEQNYIYNANIDFITYDVGKGKVFNGWFVDENMTELVDFSEMPANNIVLYGEVIASKYKIYYYINNELVNTDEYYYGDKIEVYVPEISENISFSGFENVPVYMKDYDLYVYGTTSNIVYLLSFVVDNEVINSKYYESGEEISLLPGPEKKGYIFVRWKNAEDVMPNSDLTLIAEYKAIEYKITYYVDNKVLYTDYYKYNEEVEKRSNEVKEGYLFSGWDEIPEMMPAENVVVHASFTPITYSVYYYVNDTLYQVDEYKYGEVINLPANIYVEGYNFIKWDINSSQLIMESQDMAINAILEEIPIEEESIMEKPGMIVLVSCLGTSVIAVIIYFVKKH